MVKRLAGASTIALAVVVFTFTGAFASRAVPSAHAGAAPATSAAVSAPQLPCAPSVQRPQCLLSGLTCHTRCAATTVSVTPGLPCAPSLQRPQCLLSGLSCHTRCTSTHAPVEPPAAPTMPCAPNLQNPQCILGGLSCHTRCAAMVATWDGGAATVGATQLFATVARW